jgi:hypothetical protein
VNNKIETYLGFCIRSRKILFGIDNVDKQKKGVCLLICDEELGKSSLKTLLHAQEKFGCPLLISEKGVLSERLHRPSVKAVALLDNNLAQAILSVVESEPQFKFYSGGIN